MGIKLFSEEQILDENFRKLVIEEINGKENKTRKLEASRRWELLRDQIKPHVMERLRVQGFKQETLNVMEARCTNVNIFKKFVSKKARSYTKGCDRKVEKNEKATETLAAVCKATDLDAAMKKADQYRQAFKNCFVYVYPEKTEEYDGSGKQLWRVTVKVKPPHQYDVIPSAYDKEKAACVIFSDFPDTPYPVTGAGAGGVSSSDGGRYSSSPGDAIPLQGSAVARDLKDQVIADSPRDQGANAEEYIFWTGRFHLTCDKNGKLIAGKTPEGYANPIKRIPGEVVAGPQDGSFWSTGGEDLVDGTIIVNVNLTDMLSILHMQGWGQLVVIGQNLAKKDYAVGPQIALELNYGTEEEAPTAQLLQHDPHTEDHLKAVEVIVALLLTTNNMSIRSVSAKLDASTIASGLAKMVDEADVMDDVSEDQAYFAKRECGVLGVVSAWIEVLRPTKLLLPALQDSVKFNAHEVSHKFHNEEQVITEEEKLKTYEIRQKLGINTMTELIMKDNPGMSQEEADARLLAILNERLKIRQIDPTFFLLGTLGAGGGIAQLETNPKTDADPQNDEEEPPAPNTPPRAEDK